MKLLSVTALARPYWGSCLNKLAQTHEEKRSFDRYQYDARSVDDTGVMYMLSVYSSTVGLRVDPGDFRFGGCWEGGVAGRSVARGLVTFDTTSLLAVLGCDISPLANECTIPLKSSGSSTNLFVLLGELKLPGAGGVGLILSLGNMVLSHQNRAQTQFQVVLSRGVNM
jgi:hypothetical protein